MKLDMRQTDTRRTTPAAFTLIEMLVVIAIIVLLLGLLLPAIGKFNKLSNESATKQMTTSIQMALSAYNDDFKDFPPSDYSLLTDTNAPATTFGVIKANLANWTGADLLAQALVGPRADDGTIGNGYTSDGTSSGTQYGPYLTIKNSQTVRAIGTGPNCQHVLTMASSAAGAPFLYYAPHADGKTGSIYNYIGGTTVSGSSQIWGTSGRFNTNDNASWVTKINGTGNGYDIVGNYWAKAPEGDDNQLGTDDDGPDRTAGEGLLVQLRGSKYLLVAAGSDDKYGTSDDFVVTGP